MTLAAAGSLPRLRGIRANDVGTYRPVQIVAREQHGGHGCCQDESRFGETARQRGQGAKSLVGFQDNGGDVSGLRAAVLTLRCRSWRCPCCAVRLRRRARARAFMGAAGSKVMLLTLTIDPADPRYADPRNRRGKRRPTSRDLVGDPRADTIQESVRYASWAWNRLTSNLRNRYGKVAYFRGLELQRSGMAHLHVLVRVRDAAEFMALRALLRGPESDRAAGLAVMAGFGLVVDAQLARKSGDVARYVTKMRDGAPDAAAYATKGLAGGLPRYARRASWARTWAPGWVKPTPVAGFTWRVAHASESTVRDALALSDYHVVDLERFRVTTAPGIPAGGTG